MTTPKTEIYFATRKTASAQAYEFLEEVKGQLKIENPKKEFAAVSSNNDEHGLSHIKFQQEYKGVRIYGAEIVTHANDKKVTQRIAVILDDFFSTPSNKSIRSIVDVDPA